MSLAESVTGWKVGDRVIVTGTRVHGTTKEESNAEERTITVIDGTKLTLNEPLKMAHAGDGEYRGEVANLSRNVVVESADPAGVLQIGPIHISADGGSYVYSYRRQLDELMVVSGLK